MALKKKITKEEHAKLSEHFKSEYIEDGEGFRLDVEGEEDTGALKRAKDHEVQKRKDAEKALKEAQDRVDALEDSEARKNGDVQTLENSWKKKLEDQKAADEAKIAKLTGHTTKSLVDNVALSIATKISTAPALLLPHIRSRLQADFDGDEPKTRVLDKDGKPSALTVEELSAEFVANKDFSAIITASKASGGAAKPLTKPGGGASQQNETPADLSKLTPQQMAAHVKEVKAQTE